MINYNAGVGAIGNQDDNGDSNGGDPGFDVYVPNHAADYNFLTDGAFFGGRGADQYSGYQGDVGNFAQAGGAYTESTSLQACFIDNPSGQQASSAIQNEVAAGQTTLAMAQTVVALDNLYGHGGTYQNAGGNVAIGMADLAGRGIVIGAVSALMSWAAQNFLLGGGVAAALESALSLGQEAGADSQAAKGLAGVITGVVTLESNAWTFGPLNADEQTAMNAIDRTMVGIGNSIANTGHWQPIIGFAPLAAPITAPFGSAAAYVSSHSATASASGFPVLMPHA